MRDENSKETNERCTAKNQQYSTHSLFPSTTPPLIERIQSAHGVDRKKKQSGEVREKRKKNDGLL